MKKLTLIITIAGIIGISSCKNCHTCTKTGTDDVELCKDDFGSQIALDAAISLQEGFGYSCD